MLEAIMHDLRAEMKFFGEIKINVMDLLGV